jgi:hypothetical protein
MNITVGMTMVLTQDAAWLPDVLDYFVSFTFSLVDLQIMYLLLPHCSTNNTRTMSAFSCQYMLITELVPQAGNY